MGSAPEPAPNCHGFAATETSGKSLCSKKDLSQKKRSQECLGSGGSSDPEPSHGVKLRAPLERPEQQGGLSVPQVTPADVSGHFTTPGVGIEGVHADSHLTSQGLAPPPAGNSQAAALKATVTQVVYKFASQ